jgi:hypothetical protein
MIVSVDTRLASMLSAMTGAILPAVQGNGFVTEQAKLVAGHLQVLRAQGEFCEEYEFLEHRYLRRLAAALAEGAEGGSRTTAAAMRLRGLAGKAEPTRIGEVREAHTELGTAVADFMAAEGEDGTDESVARSTTIVLEAEHAQALRDRSFNSPFGYEDGSVEIAPIQDMMRDFRTSFPAGDGAQA